MEKSPVQPNSVNGDFIVFSSNLRNIRDQMKKGAVAPFFHERKRYLSGNKPFLCAYSIKEHSIITPCQAFFITDNKLEFCRRT